VWTSVYAPAWNWLWFSSLFFSSYACCSRRALWLDGDGELGSGLARVEEQEAEEEEEEEAEEGGTVGKLGRQGCLFVCVMRVWGRGMKSDSSWNRKSGRL
jgi:hypothetical protein